MSVATIDAKNDFKQTWNEFIFHIIWHLLINRKKNASYDKFDACILKCLLSKSGVVYFGEEADRRSYLNICCQEEMPTGIVFVFCCFGYFFAFCPNFRMVPVTSYTVCFSVSIAQPGLLFGDWSKRSKLSLKSIVIPHCLLNGILLRGASLIDSSIAAIFHFCLHLQTGEAVSRWKHVFHLSLSVQFLCLASLLAGLPQNPLD